MIAIEKGLDAADPADSRAEIGLDQTLSSIEQGCATSDLGSSARAESSRYVVERELARGVRVSHLTPLGGRA